MSTISKVFTVINVVLAFFLLGVISSILARTEDYRLQLQLEQENHAETKSTLEAEVQAQTGRADNMQTANDALRTEVDSLKTEVSNLQAENRSTSNDNDQLRNAIDGINGTLSNLQAQLQDYQTRNGELMTQNEQYRTRTQSAENDKMAAEEDRARLEGDLARVEADLAETQRSMTALADQYENLQAERQALLALGVDISSLVAGTYKAIEGMVSDVGPDFVVLNVGSDAGVEVGYPFDVYRGDDYIGQVVVDRVQPKTSVARIRIPNDKGLEFQPRDRATTQL